LWSPHFQLRIARQSLPGFITTTQRPVTYTLFAPAVEVRALARQPGCPHAQSFFVWVASVLCCLQWSEQCSSVLLDGTSQ
jgi:hypothetical protein